MAGPPQRTPANSGGRPPADGPGARSPRRHPGRLPALTPPLQSSSASKNAGSSSSRSSVRHSSLSSTRAFGGSRGPRTSRSRALQVAITQFPESHPKPRETRAGTAPLSANQVRDCRTVGFRVLRARAQGRGCLEAPPPRAGGAGCVRGREGWRSPEKRGEQT